MNVVQLPKIGDILETQNGEVLELIQCFGFKLGVMSWQVRVLNSKPKRIEIWFYGRHGWTPF